MPLNNAAMVVAANALRTALAYGQLHSAAAGDGTANVTSAARQPITWASATGAGLFTLMSAVMFSGGASNGTVYSITLWSSLTGGTMYGEFVLGSDSNFDSSGNYALTMLDLTGSAT